MPSTGRVTCRAACPNRRDVSSESSRRRCGADGAARLKRGSVCAQRDAACATREASSGLFARHPKWPGPRPTEGHVLRSRMTVRANSKILATRVTDCGLAVEVLSALPDHGGRSMRWVLPMTWSPLNLSRQSRRPVLFHGPRRAPPRSRRVLVERRRWCFHPRFRTRQSCPNRRFGRASIASTSWMS